MISPMQFVDFSIRAWREGRYLQVIAHATPAGGMRQPATIKVGDFNPEALRVEMEASLSAAAAVGRELARLILPSEVWQLLRESIVAVAPRPSLGIRLRLCMDEDLIDLPWEYLYKPDVDAPGSLSGFLLIDDRISLVREPPSMPSLSPASHRTQRGLFVGTLFDDGSDSWSVRAEHGSLVKALEEHRDLITMDFVRADEKERVVHELDGDCDFFHYAGHVKVKDGRGVLVHLAEAWMCEGSDVPDGSKENGDSGTWTSSDDLAPLLANSCCKLAVFNACNSGHWHFIRPFMRVGLPAVIGIQGLVSNIAALNFAEKLYQSLAVGLSLDEALTYARLYVADRAHSYYDCDWGRFMAYMPTESSILFPRPQSQEILRAQSEIQRDRERTVIATRELTEKLDGPEVSRMMSQIAEQSVLILGRFTDHRKKILVAIKNALSTPPRQYVPILFDFEKPNDRDLIESILRFAAVSRFVIADISDPKSVPAELQAIVMAFPQLPISLIIESSQREYPVIDNIMNRGVVVGNKVVPYDDEKHLMSILEKDVLVVAESCRAELTGSD